MTHQTWTSLNDLPQRNAQRRQSSKVIVDLVRSPVRLGPDIDRVTIKLPYTSLMVAFDPHETREGLHTDKLATARFTNRAHFLPAGTALTQEVSGRPPEFLALLMDQRFAADAIAAQLDGKPVKEKPVIRNAPPSLLNLSKALRNQFLDGRKLGPLQLESFATLCLAEWLDDLEAGAPPKARKGPELRSLSRINDYIMANLEQELSLTDLAAVAELSPSYFLRAFKSATGQTPHRFLMERRVQRACDLLRQTELPLAEITYACGFASQSHMTDAFKRHLGITPGRFRRTHRA